MTQQPQVVVVVRPFHELGLTLCRLLALEGTRIVVIDRDPVVGEAFCQRLGLEGFNASYRFVDPELPEGEERLCSDLSDVYGRIQALITFFEPIAARRRINWLKLSSSAATHLVQRAFDWRLRLLRAMTPLMASGGSGVVLNVMMGQGHAEGAARPDAVVASLLNDLLAPEWERLGVRVRQVATAVGRHTPGTRDDEMSLLNDDVNRVLNMVGQPHDSVH